MNIAGLLSTKKELHENICKDYEHDILRIEETQRGIKNIRPRDPGMTLAIQRPHEKYGSAILLVREGLIVDSITLPTLSNIGFFKTSLYGLTIASIQTSR